MPATGSSCGTQSKLDEASLWVWCCWPRGQEEARTSCFHTPLPRGPASHLVSRQLFAGSSGQAYPRGGQRVFQALPNLRGPQGRVCVRIGFGVQDKQSGSILRYPSTGLPWDLSWSRVTEGSGSCTHTYPLYSLQAYSVPPLFVEKW